MNVDPTPDEFELTPADDAKPTAGATPAPEAVDARAERLAAARAKILDALRERHTIQPNFAWALLGGGLILMLAIGVVLSLLLWMIGGLFLGVNVGVGAWLVAYVICMVPVVIWFERRGRGGFFTLMPTDVDLTRDDGERELLLRRGADTLTTIANVATFGPRAFVAGLHALRGVPQKGLDLVLPEAADTLTLMLSVDGGVKIAELAPPGSDPMSIMPVLKWLDLHDYIGISSRGDRVWVSSPAKKRFAERGINVPKAEPTEARPG